MIATARVDSVVTFPSARIPNLDVLRAQSALGQKLSTSKQSISTGERLFFPCPSSWCDLQDLKNTNSEFRNQVHSNSKTLMGWETFFYVAQSPPKEIPQATM
jgi:hypothetical protein